MRVADPARGRHILETAARLFASRHYHEVRMDDVAQAAKVAKGTIYRYFADKEDLYVELILTALEGVYDEVAQVVAEVDDPEEKLLRYTRSVIRFCTEHPYFFDLVQRLETTGTRERVESLHAARDRFFRLVRSMLADLVATGTYRTTNLDLAVLTLTGMIRQILRLAKQPFPPRLAEWIVHQFLHGLHEADGGRPGKNGERKATRL